MHPPIHRLRRLLVLGCAIASIPAAAAAQRDSTSILRVIVHADEGGAPLPGTHVELIGAFIAANADSGGVARLSGVRPGPTIVSIHKMGYGDERFTLNVPPGDTISVEVDLQSQAVRLAAVTATATHSRVLAESGFLERQRHGIGSYATRTEWEGRGRLNFTDIMRRMRGIRVARTEDGRSLLVSGRGNISLGSMCSGVLLFVDGVQVNVDGRYDDVNNLVPASELEAVEAYAGPSEIPAQYNQTGSACGVVLAWRRGAR
jgi:TonB-dependent Receptor Plug Domain